MKKETQELIDELLISVPIEVNYKHDIFLKETDKYAKYQTKLLKSPQYKKGGHLEGIYTELLQEKKKITFTDIKLDIIHKSGEEKLKELEDKYIKLNISKAEEVDNTFSDFFKDEIADKFLTFLFAVDNAKKRPTDKYLVRVKRNTKLVYADGIEPPYQFKELDSLLDTIAKSAVCYCNDGIDFSTLNNISPVKSSKEKITPLFLRKICALTCYTLLDFGNYVSIKTLGKQLDASSGVVKQIMTDLQTRCKNLGYEYFKKGNKVFRYDKWSILPEEMLRRRSYIPPRIPMSYAGIKEGYLGYMISEIQKQIPYKNFIDAFGGSGTASVQFRHIKDSKYYINDFHFANVAYYRVLKAPASEYKKFLDCLILIQKCMKIAVENDTSGKWIREQFNDFTKALFSIYTNVSDVCINTASLNYVRFNGICFDFLETIKMVDSSYNSCDFPAYIIVAAIFVAFANMTISGSLASYVITTAKSFINIDIKDFKAMFDNLRTLYKDINIVDEYGADAIQLLNSEDLNNETTFAYLDSPYIGTMEYDASEGIADTKYPKGTVIDASDCGKEFISNDFPMDSLLDACDNFKGNFIFSCRLNMPSPEPQGIVTNTFTGNKEDDKAERGKSISRNKTFQHYNNYIWFFNRWLDMKNIDNCYVFCMLDTDWNFIVHNKFALYYLNENFPAHYRPVDLEFKDEFIKSDWGMDLSDEFKEKVFDYLRAVIYCGQNLEIMITNFDCNPPHFESMYEYLTNVYDKRTDPISRKVKTNGELINDAQIETRIPDNGKFVKIPMKLLARFVLTEFKNTKRSFKI